MAKAKAIITDHSFPSIDVQRETVVSAGFDLHDIAGEPEPVAQEVGEQHARLGKPLGRLAGVRVDALCEFEGE